MNNILTKAIRAYKGESLIESIKDYTVIDIETTGFDTSNDKIIELAAIKIRNNQIVDKYSTLINPEIIVDEFITKLTGINNELLINAPTIDKKIKDYINFIGNDVVIGHNVNFDINFIYDRYNEYFSKFFSNDYIDTLRISKKIIKGLNNYKLKTLAENFDINYDNAHRAFNDCIITNELYQKLKKKMEEYELEREKYINSIKINKNINSCVIKGVTEQYSQFELLKICKNNGIDAKNYFKSGKNDYDYIVLSFRKYDAYKLSGGDHYYDDRTKKVISEFDFYDMIGLPYSKRGKRNNHNIKSKDIISENSSFDTRNPIYTKECVFTGTLEKMTRKDAMQIVANLGGKNRDTVTKETNYLILGNNDYCKSIKDGKSTKQKKAESYKLKGYDIEIISENVFYDMINDYINI